MISLFTGLPGQGKTLSIIIRLYKLNEAKETRTIYIAGIDHLKAEKLPNLDIELIDYEQAKHWKTFKSGSLIIIDEAQHWAEQRAKGKAPSHITELSEHRHGGYDFWLITQDPRLLDAWARRLINYHQNVKRLFNTKIQLYYIWDKVQDDLKDRREIRYARKKFGFLKQEHFDLYESSVENNLKGSFPLGVVLGLSLIFLLPVLGYFAYDYIKNFNSGTTDNPSTTPDKNTPQAQASKIASNEHNSNSDSSTVSSAPVLASNFFKIDFCHNNGRLVDRHVMTIHLKDSRTIQDTPENLLALGFPIQQEFGKYSCKGYYTHNGFLPKQPENHKQNTLAKNDQQPQEQLTDLIPTPFN